MSGLLRRGGFRLVDNDLEADAILLNTCSVREHAEHRVISRVGELRARRAQSDLATSAPARGRSPARGRGSGRGGGLAPPRHRVSATPEHDHERGGRGPGNGGRAARLRPVAPSRRPDHRQPGRPARGPARS